MSKVQQLTDAALMQRATRAGRNLLALAILATLLAAMALAGVAVELPAPPLSVRSALLMASILVATGLWTLSIAAKRGNPASVGVVMGVMSLQLLVALVGFCLSSIRVPHEPQPSLLGVIIALIVIAALAGSRNMLLELKQRGLWEERFGSAKPSRHLCVLGGTLLIVGYVGVMASLFLPAFWAAQYAKQHAKEMEKAQAFVHLIKGEEAEFMAAVQAMGGASGPEVIKNAASKLAALDQKVTSLKRKVSANEPLSSILMKYGDAVRDWRNGLTVLDSPQPDREKATKMLQSGDRFRTEATQQFDHHYVRPQSK